MDYMDKLRGKRLGRVGRSILYHLCDGLLEEKPLPGRPLSQATGHLVWCVADDDPGVWWSKDRPNESDRVVTYRALRRLEDMGLVEGFRRDDYLYFEKRERSKQWQLTILGMAVSWAYCEEIEPTLEDGWRRYNKPLKWSSKRINPYLEALL